ncbi:hypothetical protein [Agaribacter flavus]|uniref:TIGR03016 family PEP-CTERM system-associated outer membrane protein n=1 Tax=Agaribacter flavus TaxID=1902781 RepID=A0ABV7FKL3_9ALTE
MDSNHLKFKCFLLLLATLNHTNGYSGELSFDSGITGSYTRQIAESKDGSEKFAADNWTFSPFLSAIYTAKRMNGAARAQHQHIRRSLDGQSLTNNYTNYRGNVNLTLVENLLQASANASQNFRGVNLNSVGVDDFLLNEDDLAKINNYGGSLTLSLRPKDYFGLNANLRYSKFDAENNVNDTIENENINFGSENFGAQFSLQSGPDFRPFAMQVRGATSVTKRTERNDFESSRANANFGFPIFTPKLLFTTVFSYENNEVPSVQTGENLLREFYSYGAGLTWRSSQNKFIRVTWNQSKIASGAGFQEETDNFLAGTINWQLSSRTELRADYSRRFFGETANILFRHNTRHWRNVLSYTETISTASSIIQNEEVSLFACPNTNNISINDCELLDSLDPANLPPDSVFVPFQEISFELSPNVVIRKRALYTSGIQRRRSNLSLTVSRTEDEDVERDLVNTIDSLQLSASINISSRSSIVSSIVFSDLERRTINSIEESRVNRFNLAFERQISRKLRTAIGYTYLDRDGDNAQNAGGFGANGLIRIDGPLTDNRITASLTYKFSK